MRVRGAVRRHGDLGVAVALFVLAQVELFARRPAHDAGWLLRCVVLAACTLPVAWRRRYPVPVVIVVSVVGEAATVASGNVDTFYAVVAGALLMYYSVGAYGGRRAWVGLAVGLVSFWAADAWARHPATEYVASGVLVTGPWLAGLALRHQRAQSDRLRRLADDLVAQRERAERAAVEAERGRIAREMHDVLAHALSLIAVQADAACAALEVRPSLAVAAVETIRDVSRESLQDMRRALHVLHDNDHGAVPTLRDLGRLLDTSRAAGLIVALEVEGTLDDLPPLTDLAAYRLVQEALTNVRKHSSAASARVHVRNRAGELLVEVADDGVGVSAADATSPGYGLLGLRERVEAQGGLFSAAACEGGWRVAATVPVPCPSGR